MITLSEACANIGNKVLYRPSSGAPPDEEGVITSVQVSDGWVFVRYAANAGSQATRPDDLTLVAPIVCRCGHPAGEHWRDRQTCMYSTPTETFACGCSEMVAR